MSRFGRSCLASRHFRAKAISAVLVLGALTACGDRRIEPPPAEGRDFPNLATVPVPPTVAPRAERQSEMEALVATRETAIREDEEVRAIDPGRALPAPRPRGPASAQRSEPSPDASPQASRPAEEAPAPRPQAAAPMPRPELPSSLYMGSVAGGDRGAMAEIDRKVLADAVAMARRTSARVRLDGGRSAEDRQRIAEELVRLGLAAPRISTGPARGASPAAERPAIDVFVEY